MRNTEIIKLPSRFNFKFGQFTFYCSLTYFCKIQKGNSGASALSLSTWITSIIVFSSHHLLLFTDAKTYDPPDVRFASAGRWWRNHISSRRQTLVCQYFSKCPFGHPIFYDGNRWRNWFSTSVYVGIYADISLVFRPSGHPVYPYPHFELILS